jgi:multiple antibiotic resistance protein
MDWSLVVSVYIKFFFLMTPFFVLSMFLAMTKEEDTQTKKRLALHVSASVIFASTILLFFGTYIFDVFGITLDAFRIGAGALLFLTAVALIQGPKTDAIAKADMHSIAVVPLAIPITIGPGTIGALLVMSAGMEGAKETLQGLFALILAVGSVGVMLYFSSAIEKVVGRSGLTVLSKITGLVLAALSAQIIFTGIKNFLAL